MLHGKILAHFHRDRLWVRLFALFPEHKRRINLQLLRDNCPESEDGLLVCGFVGLDRHSFDLSAGAIANVKSCGNLPASARGDFILLGLCGSATAGSVNRLKVHWCLAGILIFEMAYCLFVGSGWVQLD